jgi:murein DD-endopeptidase MepM/ murein hydrolase activator NlpD
VQLRRSHRQQRLGELTQPRAVWKGVLLSLALAGLSACASSPPSDQWYTMRKGDNLYRVGLRFEVTTDALVRANGIRDVHEVAVGTRLRIPAATRPATRPSATRKAAAIPKSKTSSDLRSQARKEARRESQLDFSWPVEGYLSSGFGRRNGRSHQGIDMRAKKGTRIRAAESGKVIHAGRLGDYGRVVILKHSGDYRTVYGHARKTLVSRGDFVEKGETIAEVGSTGNASGPHLHFEIRRKEEAKDPILYLPR